MVVIFQRYPLFYSFFFLAQAQSLIYFYFINNINIKVTPRFMDVAAP